MVHVVSFVHFDLPSLPSCCVFHCLSLRTVLDLTKSMTNATDATVSILASFRTPPRGRRPSPFISLTIEGTLWPGNAVTGRVWTLSPHEFIGTMPTEAGGTRKAKPYTEYSNKQTYVSTYNKWDLHNHPVVRCQDDKLSLIPIRTSRLRVAVRSQKMWHSLVRRYPSTGRACIH